MSIIAASGISKSFVTQLIFSDATFRIEEKDRIGIVGTNGAGKTTLFKILTGAEDVDEGTIFYDKRISVSYMEQHTDYTSTKTPLQEVEEVFAELDRMEKRINELTEKLSIYGDKNWIEEHARLLEEFENKGGLTYKGRCRSTLLGLGFNEKDLELPMCALSGGQRTRVMLAKTLLMNCDIMLLDEPTNHLDMDATRWLENFLMSYKNAFMVISHDRYFLDRVTTKTFEIENQKLTCYNGNYTKYKELKALDRLTLERDYEKKQKEVKRIEGIIAKQKTFGQERNYVTIRSKQKQIDRIVDSMEKPDQDPESVRFSFKACSGTGYDVLTINNLAKSFGEKEIFKNVNMEIKAGDRSFIFGANGCGKTTLLRTVIGQIEADAGTVKTGARVKIGYFEQGTGELNGDKTAFDELLDEYPHLTNTEIRSVLGTFLFKGDDVFKQIKTLSGGEYARIKLAKFMLADTNFLILDEPTNHLDIQSKEVLEQALENYDGTILAVSHDRYFIQKLANNIFVMNDKGVKQYKCSYTEFEEIMEKGSEPVKAPDSEKKPKEESDYAKRKQIAAEERKKKNRLENLEKKIKETEDQKADLEKQLEDPEISGDYTKLTEISKKIEEFQQLADELFEEWSELAEE